MRKSTIFVSAVFTTFALVMLYNVASAYRNNQTATQVAATTIPPTATVAPDPTDGPTPTKAFLSPQEAAQLAAQVVGNANLLSAESSNINGTDAYKITFTNNDIVYVGLDGHILSVQVAPLVVNATLPQIQPAKKYKGNRANQASPASNSSAQSEASSENQQEHED